MTDPLAYLRGVVPHECGASCPHRAGAAKEEGKGGVTAPVAGGTAQAPSPPNPTLDPICEDCEDPLSKHDGPGGSNPWLACKHFVPVGPKE